MSLTQVSVPLSRDQAYALVDAIMEAGDLAVAASAHEDEETGNWVFEATCAVQPDLERFAEIARAALAGEVEFAAEAIDPRINWVARSLEGLPPVAAGNFYVYGSHAEAPPPAGSTPIHIDAAQAFGTGHHETTSGCLIAIDRVLKRRRPRYMLDVGTGTGILAIGLAKRVRLPVIASDVDPIATRTTRENARDNGVGPRIHAVTATGLAHPAIAGNGPYDLIVANILAAPLVKLAPAMSRALRRPGTLILSGLLATQAPAVISAYRRCGLVLSERLVRKDWATLTLVRR